VHNERLKKDRNNLSDWEKPRSVEGRKEDLQSGVKGVQAFMSRLPRMARLLIVVLL
jgi:hypothetical protein